MIPIARFQFDGLRCDSGDIDCREVDPVTGEFVYSTRTKQSDKDSCDINNILKRYEKTGVLPDMIRSNPAYGDFSRVPEYQESLNIVLKAEEQFMALPAAIRDRFGNDPVKMLAFCSDPSNKDEMVRLGLAIKLPPQPAPAVENSTPVSSGAPSPDSGKGVPA